MVKQMINEKLEVYVKFSFQNISILSFNSFIGHLVFLYNLAPGNMRKCWNRTDESILDIL